MANNSNATSIVTDSRQRQQSLASSTTSALCDTVQPVVTKQSPLVVRLMRASAICISLLIASFCWFAFYSGASYLVAICTAACYSLAALVGIAYSDKFLHTFLLSFPTLFTSKGRVVIMGVALSLLSREVIYNIQLNTEEIVRSSDCVKQYGQQASLAASDAIVTIVRGIMAEWISLGEQFRRNLRITSAIVNLFSKALEELSSRNAIYATALSGFVGDPKFGLQLLVHDFRLNVSSSQSVNQSMILDSLAMNLEGVTRVLNIASDCFLFVSLIAGGRLFYSSWRYLQHYLTSNSFHNVYVEHESSIVHLRGTKYANKYVVLSSARLARSEMVHIKIALPMFLVDCLVAAINLVYNATISWILSIVSEATTTEIPVAGTIDVGWDVHSSLKLSRTSYSAHHPYNISVSLGRCAPVAHQIPLIVYYKVFVLFGITFICLCLSGYAQRLQHVLLDSWYPERMRTRKFWLVKKLLFQRSRAMTQDSVDYILNKDKQKTRCFSFSCTRCCSKKKTANTIESAETFTLVQNAQATDETDCAPERRDQPSKEGKSGKGENSKAKSNANEKRKKGNKTEKRNNRDASFGWSWTRRVIAALMSSSILAAITIVYFVLVYHWSVVFSAFVASFVSLIFLIGCVVSYRFMCVVVVMFPSLLASQGRCMLLALGMTLVMAGPGYNALLNLNSFVQSTSCAAHANYNYTQRLREETAKQVELTIQKWTGIVKNANNYLEEEYKKFVKQAEENTWANRLFGHVSSRLCTAILPALCPAAVPQKFTLDVQLHELKITESFETEMFRDKLFAELHRHARLYANAAQNATRGVQLLVFSLEILTFITVFSFTAWYVRKWTRSIKYDNVYITKDVETRCKEISEDPTSRAENNIQEEMQRAAYIRTTSLILSRHEMQQTAGDTISTLIVAVAAGSVILFDYLIALLLDTLNECSHAVSFSSSAKLHLDYEIVGLGKLSYYRLRDTAGIDNFTISLDSIMAGCVNSASYTATGTYINIICLFIAAAFTLLTVCYMQRVRIILLNSMYPRLSVLRKRLLIEKICYIKLKPNDHPCIPEPFDRSNRA